MNQKKLTKTIMMISSSENPSVPQFILKYFSAVRVNDQYLENWQK